MPGLAASQKLWLALKDGLHSPQNGVATHLDAAQKPACLDELIIQCGGIAARALAQHALVGAVDAQLRVSRLVQAHAPAISRGFDDGIRHGGFGGPGIQARLGVEPANAIDGSA